MSLTAQKTKKRLNKFMITLIIVVCITIFISVTFAWFTYRANKNIEFTIGQVDLEVERKDAEMTAGAPLVCNQPLVDYLRFKRKSTTGDSEGGSGDINVKSVDCYVRIFFQYEEKDGTQNIQHIISELNKRSVETYSPQVWDAEEAFNQDNNEAVSGIEDISPMPTSRPDYVWTKDGDTNYYYLTQAGNAGMMYKIDDDEIYYFARDIRFPDVPIINHLVDSTVTYKIIVQAVQANHLYKINPNGELQDVNNPTVEDMSDIMRGSFS